MKKYILSLDQGTTSTRAILFDKEQNIIGMAQREVTQYFPKPGWVEQNAMEIYASAASVISEVIAKTDIDESEIAAIGITNQRETTIVWDKNTGKPIANAIVWQCRRTADICEQIKATEFANTIKQKTGLLADAYFSATKLKWILDHIPHAREEAQKGNLLFGTVDTWLIWKLTDGRAFVTDATNASRTMLFDIHTLRWDEEICSELDIPMQMLPEVRTNSEIYGLTLIGNTMIPIAGSAGDQHAALFGQTCFEKGQAKNTYGTGCFLLMNTGEMAFNSQKGLLTTIAIAQGGKVQYALEGSIFVGGALIQWLRDQLGLVAEAKDTEYFAGKVPNNGGVYIVPAFTGLGAPYWDMYARGTIVGLTRGSNRNHIIRAALEAIAYQVHDVLATMTEETGIVLDALNVDGGASANHLLMQFQADINNKPVIRPRILETTALGAAYLAGLAVGFYQDIDEIRSKRGKEQQFEPNMDEKIREQYLSQWRKAVRRSMNWDR